MATRYKLINPTLKEHFDLGKGYWHNIFDYKEPFALKDIFSSKENLAEYLKKNSTLYIPVKNSTTEQIAKRIWDWAEDKTLYFGNDVSICLDENEKEISGEEYDSTGHIYW